MVFETDSGKVPITNMNNAKIENLSTGVIAFTVSKKDSETILQAQNRTAYLISVGQDGTETLIYTGEWRKATEQSDIDLAIATAKEEGNALAQLQSTLNEIKAQTLVKDTASSVIPNTIIKKTAVAPVVNKFGVPLPQRVSPNSANAGRGSSSEAGVGKG